MMRPSTSMSTESTIEWSQFRGSTAESRNGRRESKTHQSHNKTWVLAMPEASNALGPSVKWDRTVSFSLKIVLFEFLQLATKET